MDVAPENCAGGGVLNHKTYAAARHIFSYASGVK